jgi:hypothetical protein
MTLVWKLSPLPLILSLLLLRSLKLMWVAEVLFEAVVVVVVFVAVVVE